MAELKFTKMQGLGNDFMVVDATKQPCELSSADIRLLSDRRHGVGFDQLLLLLPSDQPNIDFNYRIYNADGSCAEQCGNGARCIGLFIFENKLSTKQTLHIQAPKAVLEIVATKEGEICVKMDQPDFNPEHLPMLTPQTNPPYVIKVEHLSLEYYVVNIGNPHVIIKLEHTNLLPHLNMIGKNLNQHPTFPQGINVSLVQVINEHELKVNVYERGAGLTPACGSAACASAVVAIKYQWAMSPLIVELPGGKLLISWNGEKSNLMMQGPAKTVYHGEISLPL